MTPRSRFDSGAGAQAIGYAMARRQQWLRRNPIDHNGEPNFQYFLERIGFRREGP